MEDAMRKKCQFYNNYSEPYVMCIIPCYYLYLSTTPWRRV